jgi:formate C-acetyltransferase
MEITLNNGRCGGKQLGPVTGEITSFHCIEDFIEAFRTQMKYFIGYMIEADNCIDIAHAQTAPLPYQSALIEGCIESGKSTQEGGAIFNFSGPQGFGVIDAGDSLYCIQKNVFEDKTITLEQLKDALENNFGYPVGPGGSTELSSSRTLGSCGSACGSEAEMEQKIYEAVRSILSGSGSVSISDVRKAVGEPAADNTAKYAEIRRILQNTTGYGNDIDEVDQYAVICARIYCEIVETYKNPRGGQYHAGMYPVSANVLYGKDVWALPTGRLAKTPLADGVSPRAGIDTHGPTAAANSVSKLDHSLASNGTLYNQKFLPAALAGDAGLMNFAALIRGYFERKGFHIQFNVVDKETLLDAQNRPENHKDLVVRVAGYSAHFTRLSKEVQDGIIARTEQTF